MPHHHDLLFGDHMHMMEFFADYLNLSDTQQAQMKAVLEKEHATLKPLMQQLHQAHKDLRQYQEGAFDEAKVRTLATQQAQTLTELTVQETRIHSELFQMLTPDQQAKMKEFEARHEARMQKHMNQMHEGTSAPPEQQ
jgi:protein CpxP